MLYEKSFRKVYKDVMEPHRDWDFEHCDYCRSFIGIKATMCLHCGTKRSFADRNLAQEVVDFRQKQVIQYNVLYGGRQIVKPWSERDPVLALGVASIIFLVLQYVVTIWINGEYTFWAGFFGILLSVIPFCVIIAVLLMLERVRTNTLNGGPIPEPPPYNPETLNLIERDYF